jgi:hypothetical protein
VILAAMPPATGLAFFLLGGLVGLFVGASWMHRVHEIEEQERTRKLERVLRDRERRW